ARVILGRDVEHAALLHALVTPVTAERDGVTEIERDERLAAAGLMERIGNVAGPLLAAAVFTLFLFKSCFVGAMLFGQRRLSERAHTVLVLMVALGVTLAALWPVALFSWSRTPSGAFFSNGQIGRASCRGRGCPCSHAARARR